jgi:hypothetical protein
LARLLRAPSRRELPRPAQGQFVYFSISCTYAGQGLQPRPPLRGGNV